MKTLPTESDRLRAELLNTHRDYLKLLKQQQQYIFGYWLRRYLEERTHCSTSPIPLELLADGIPRPTQEDLSRAEKAERPDQPHRKSRSQSGARPQGSPTPKAAPRSEKSQPHARRSFANKRRAASATPTISADPLQSKIS